MTPSTRGAPLHPRVSVLLPYRDAAGTIEEALGSLLDERGLAFEVIAVDDGSRDDGAARALAIARRDARVVLTATRGLGIAGALAHAASIARGELVARMDTNDVLGAGPPRGVGGAARRAPQSRRGRHARGGLPRRPRRRGGAALRGVVERAGLAEDHHRDIFVESPLCHPSVTMRRDALDAAGGYRDVPWPEDYDLWLRLHAAGWKIAKVPATLLRWRHHERRATVTNPRYALARFDALKGRYLAPRL